MKKTPVNCLRCKHYYTTWEKGTPHGCKAYQFKSRFIPSQIVQRESNQECQLMEDKRQGGQGKVGESDLNNEDLW